MWIGELWRKWEHRLRRERHARELEEEMRLHRELLERSLREQGAADAPYAARRSFGNATQLRETVQEMWGWRWADDFFKDLRYALRGLAANPMFAAVAISTLALGIGANTAVFSTMNAVAYRSLPVPEPERLVYLRTTAMVRGASNTGDFDSSFPVHVFEALRGERGAFAEVVAYVPMSIGKTAVRFGNDPEEADAQMVSGNFFSGLGAGMTCGRAFTLEDERGHTQTAVLSHGYWRRRFAADCSVVGKTLHVRGVPFTIAGVAAEGFTGVDGAGPAELWVPLQDRPDLNAWGMRADGTFYHSPNWWCLLLMARLAPGVGERRALALANPAFQRAALAYAPPLRAEEKPPSLYFLSAQGVPGMQREFGRPLRILLGMVALVLLIACGNVALLLAARNAAREREFSVRVALGGGRARLFRQLLTESLVLVAAGAGLGWLFAITATGALRSWSELELNLSPDRTVLLFTLAVSAVAALVFGLAPLRRAARAPSGLSLRAASTGFARGGMSRKATMAVQVALCVVLLTGAGLLARTLRNLELVNLGLRAEGLVVFGLSPRQMGVEADSFRFYRVVMERLRGLAGVESVSLSQNRLGTGWSNNTSVFVDGKSPNGDRPAMFRWNGVGPDYFRTFGIPILEGREFTDADVENAPRTVVVNETFVKRYMEGRSPLGRLVARARLRDAPSTIVGVAADSKYTGVREAPQPMAYFPYFQVAGPVTAHFVLRTSRDPVEVLGAARGVVRELAPDLPLMEPTTQRQQFEWTYRRERLFARLAIFFGLLAAALVATGLYGTLAYSVSRRTAEVGVRMALGARRGQVVWMVLRESVAVCGAGVGIGVPLAMAASRMLESVLFNVRPVDFAAFAVALAGIAAVALAASFVPAYRAASVNPMSALRWE